MSHQHVASSSFHQVNKAHSTGRHDTKGTLRKKQKGKVEARVSVKNASKALSKQDKRKQQQELAKSKKNAILERKRFGTIEGAPKIVAMVALGPVEDSEKMQNLLLAHCGKPGASTFGEEGPCTVSLTSKQRMTLFNAPRDIISVLDISKVADILLLIIPANEGIDKTGEKLISVIKAQGVPNVIGIIEGTDKIPAKKQHDVKKSHQKTLHQHFPDEPRLLPLDTAEDATQVIRFVENCTVRAVHWREKRPYLFVDKLSADEASAAVGTVRVSGYLRGGNLSANQLVHLPGIGDFQLRKIEMISDPFPVGRVRAHDTETMAGDVVQTLAVDEPDNNQETLETENTPDLLLNEQTWPTPEELAGAKKKKGPKGTSDYQAVWLDREGEGEGEGEEGEEEEGEENEEEHGQNQDMEDEGEHKANGEHDDEGDEEGDDAGDEDGLSDAESIAESTISKAGSESSRLSKSERADDELNFPDEVETPLDKPARVRFQKYRGLKSFKTTEWDPKENLPLDYGRIFQFSNFNRSMKKATDTTDNKIPAGCYVTLHIDKVPLSYAKNFDPKKPYVVGGLFKYENKMSVLQFNILKHHTYEAPVQSKDSLVFHVGVRRYTCEPIYSIMSPGCTKQKFERFLQPSRPSCATIYGPVTFPPNPLLVFNPESGDLVATGSLHSVDPDRIVVKKIILAGKPYKVHRKGAVIRDMFHFAEDANWFKPVELWTKNGKVGHIKESVGTHGDIKCLFDNPIQQHDTVCLSLYKRVFPKWPKVSPSRQFQIGTSDESQKSDKAENDNMAE